MAERRFRGSIYVDVFVPESDDLEKDRSKAEWIMNAISKDIRCENYVGGVAQFRHFHPLDREI